MNLYTNVIIRTSFIATHSWTGCPHEEVEFLCYPHRHKFFVEMKFKVNHDDRDIEFIMMKEKIDKFLSLWEGTYLGDKSCEMIAKQLLKHFDAVYVSVFEDDENGAEVFI